MCLAKQAMVDADSDRRAADLDRPAAEGDRQRAEADRRCARDDRERDRYRDRLEKIAVVLADLHRSTRKDDDDWK